jgi:hypothetical protein
MHLEWRPRVVPLTPCGAFAQATAVPALAQAMRALPTLQQARLTVVEHAAALLVLGAADDLPWSEGVRYVGCEDTAAQLLLPTLMQPNWPLDVLARACARRAAGSRWLLLDEPAVLWGLL